MRTLAILLAAALIAGLAWAQPFGPNEGRGPVGQAKQIEAQVQVQASADVDCDGEPTMTRTGQGEGDQAMLQRQLKSADGQHAAGPKGAQRGAGNR
jgi:hypothetical protein